MPASCLIPNRIAASQRTKPAPKPLGGGGPLAILVMNCSPQSCQSSTFVHNEIGAAHSETLWKKSGIITPFVSAGFRLFAGALPVLVSTH